MCSWSFDSSVVNMCTVHRFACYWNGYCMYIGLFM
uniref:Uncharacterized protein n=1 Tax=Rhizophora mucronata TaxID=61149 RepID=A0A2P2PDQ7_RHIMU